MPVDPERVQAVFLAAVERQTAVDRAAILDRECSGDPELRQRVESLLRANDKPDSFLLGSGSEQVVARFLQTVTQPPNGDLQ
jgi:hypothetical protein